MSLEQMEAQMAAAGVRLVTPDRAKVTDESAFAYKDIDAVMAASADLVTPTKAAWNGAGSAATGTGTSPRTFTVTTGIAASAPTSARPAAARCSVVSTRSLIRPDDPAVSQDTAAEVVAYIEWVDAGIAATRWEDRADALKTASRITTGLIRSAGLLLEQNAERVVIAGSLNPNNDDVNLVMAIPRACISRMDVWTPKRKRP